MRSILVLIVVAGFALCGGCQEVTYLDAYPQHFPLTATPVTTTEVDAERPIAHYAREVGLQVAVGSAPISPDIVASLPVDYQLYELAGALICVLDPYGYFSAQPPFESSTAQNPDRTIQTHRSKATTLACQTLIDHGFEMYASAALPHVTCFIPPVAIEDILDDDYALDWIECINRWQDGEVTLDKINADIAGAIEKIGDELAAIAALDNRIASTKQQAEQVDIEIAALNADIEALRRSLGGRIGGPKFDLDKVYKPKMEYDPKRDPLVDALKENMVDIRDKPYYSDHARTPYLDAETVNALDRAYEILKNPSAEVSPELAQEILEAGLKPENFKLESAARTPWGQVDAAAKNPKAAKYLDSNHLVGVAVDLIMNGTPFDVRHDTFTEAQLKAYNALCKVLAAAGLVASEPFKDVDERNHFELTKYSLKGNPHRTPADVRTLNEKRLKMLKAFQDAAQKAAERQQTKVDTLKTQLESVLKRVEQLKKDVEEKTRQLEQENMKLKDKQTERDGKRKERDQLIEEKDRRERQERERKEREQKNKNGRHIEDGHTVPREPKQPDSPKEKPHIEHPVNETPVKELRGRPVLVG